MIYADFTTPWYCDNEGYSFYVVYSDDECAWPSISYLVVI